MMWIDYLECLSLEYSCTFLTFLLKFFYGALELWEGLEVHWDDNSSVGKEFANSVSCFSWTHCEKSTNWKEEMGWSVEIVNDIHIIEDICISSMIDSEIMGADNKASCFSTNLDA